MDISPTYPICIDWSKQCGGTFKKWDCLCIQTPPNKYSFSLTRSACLLSLCVCVCVISSLFLKI